MAKFAGPSVTPGQPGSIQLPTEQIGEQIPTTQPAPQQTGTFIDDIGAAPEPVEGSETAALEEQLERERIPTLEERKADMETVQRWDPRAKPTVPEADGGLEERAGAMVAAFGGLDPITTLGITPPTPETKALAKEGFTSAVAAQAAERTPGSLVAALNRSGAVTSTQRADNTWSNQVDNAMLMVGSVVTENMLSDSAFGTPEEDAVILDPDAKTAPVAKAKGNAALGQQIHAEYSRLKNAEQGIPTDQYEKLPDAEANTLGDAFKEMWYKVNGKDLEDAGQPPLVLREETPGGETFFQLTELGKDKLGPKGSGPLRKRLFNKGVRPAKTPTKSGQLPGEQGRTVVKRKTGKVKKALAGAEVLEEATRNLNDVPNVVDSQRLRVLYTTILPVLAGQLDHTSWEATINNIGKKQWKTYAAQEIRDQRDRAEAQAAGRPKKGEPYNAAKQMETITNNVAQEVRAIATERKGANHLTYQIQAATGRIDPQQLHFNPTTSKAVRFVTRNVVPAKATPGSRIARNLEQMYAMMLVKGADVLLPDGRIEAFKKAEPQLEAWGDRLAEALDESMTDEQAEAISQAIEEGTPLTDPNFPPFNTLGLDPGTDADLINAIEKKGEDGPAFIDGVIDAAKYIKAKREGRPYHSYFNAYVDGKTNGIASNGIQMGNEQIAKATGVMRNNAEQLLDAGDIRDQLAAALTSKMDHDGFDGHLKDETQQLYDVANVLFNYRDLNKATTMTFSYGKELASFQEDIKQHLELARQDILNDPEQAGSTYPDSLDSLLSDPKWGEDKLVSTLLNFYAQGMTDVLSQDALDSRALVRGAGLMFALTDQLFTIQSPTGFELAMGGERAMTPTEGKVTYGIGGKQVQAGRHASYPSSAAAKVRSRDEGEAPEQELGGVVHGQAVTSPVHSIDAATVALSAAGKSWDKMKQASNGNPYMHPIYDAFKFDAMGFDVGVQEVNKNWLDSTMNWSYLREAHDSTQAALDAWYKQSRTVPDSTPVSIDRNGQYAMMGYLLEPHKTKQGVEPARLINKLTKTMEFGKNDNRREVAKDAARRIIREMNNQGIDFRNLPNEVTMAQLRVFVRAVQREIDILPRLTKMANKTDAKKRELRKKIRGEENYQYYAH